MKKKKLFTLLAGFLAGAAIMFSGYNLLSNGGFVGLFASPNSYTLSLNQSNGKYTSTKSYKDGTYYSNAKTTNGNTIKLAFNRSCSNSSAKFVQLEAGKGNFYNVDAITGIYSISVSFTTYSSGTKMSFFFGSESNPTENEISEIVSGKTYSVENEDFPSELNFLKVKSTSKAIKVDSVTIKYSCTNEPVDPESITLTPSSANIGQGGTKQLTVNYFPTIANQNKEVTWLTSDATVATVKDGLVSVLGTASVGSTATITAKLTNLPSITATCDITVTEPQPGYEKRDVSFLNYNLGSGFAPANGKQKILLVPIALSGTPTYKWNETYYGYMTANQTRIHDYYYNASMGKLDVTVDLGGTLAKMYQSSFTESSFDENTVGEDEAWENLYSMIESATSWVQNTFGINLDDYDSDDDGYVDSIHFMVDGSDKGEWGSALWPHMNTMNVSAGTTAKPVTNTYSMSNLNHISDAWTTIHEQGHIYGIEDYYDYAYKMDTIGSYDMQSYGVMDWNSFSKLSNGWVSPYYVDGTSDSFTIEIEPSATTGDCILIPSSGGWNGTPFDEYILIELFANCGNNSYFWGKSGGYSGNAGCRVYHVDARLWEFNYSHYNQYQGTITGGRYVDDPTAETSYTYWQIAHDNTVGNEYASPQVTATKDAYRLLHLIQSGGTNTFENTSSSARHELAYDDLFVTGDTFSIGSHNGYTNYGPSFFEESTTFNNGEAFNYGIKFVSVSSTKATIEITKF